MRKDFFIFIFIVTFSIILISILKFPTPRVIDNPPGVHQFYGNVYYANASLIEDGAIVKALVNNETKASVSTLQGKYGYNPVFIIEDVLDGSIINFYVNNNKVNEYVFKNFELTELNLQLSICGDNFCSSSESCSSCSLDCGSCPSASSGADGGSGGGGGGGGGGAVCNTYALTNEQLIQGYSKELAFCEKLSFSIENKIYSATLLTITGTSTAVSISNLRASLNLDEEELFDLNNDGNADISLRLISITGNKAELTIQLIYRQGPLAPIPGCQPNWQCMEWGSCNNKIKTRSCQDTNNCNTIEGKPAEVRGCQASFIGYLIAGLILAIILTIIIIIILLITQYRKEKSKEILYKKLESK